MRTNLHKPISDEEKKSLASNLSFFQPKLTINQPNDIYEQEADVMADKVMRMPDTSMNNNSFFKPAISSVQRKCAYCEEEEKLQRKENTSQSTEASSETNSYINSLSSKGSSLPKEAQSFFEPRFGYNFSDVKIHTDSEAAKSANDINALAYTTGNNIVFNQNQFSPENNSGKKLLAHELTHIVQQQKNITNEKIIRLKKSNQFNYAGKTIGINTDGKEVKIVREIGSTEGYAQKWQAISICRMANADPAAVMKDSNNMWHALEVTENFYDGLIAARDFSSADIETYALPSSKYINEEKQKDPRSSLYASLALGINEKNILFNIDSTERKTGKINFDADMARTVGSDLGHTGPENPLDSFSAGQSYAIELNTNLLDDPQKASGTLFHESSHLSDYEFAQAWVLRYQAETKRLFVSSYTKPFQDWITAQAPTRLTKGDAEVVSDMSAGITATSEARAYTNTIIAAIEAGNFDIAKDQAETYASTKVPKPANGSFVVSELIAEIKSVYKSMSPDMKKNLEQVIIFAKNKNSDVWLSQLVLK